VHLEFNTPPTKVKDAVPDRLAVFNGVWHEKR